MNPQVAHALSMKFHSLAPVWQQDACQNFHGWSAGGCSDWQDRKYYAPATAYSPERGATLQQFSVSFDLSTMSTGSVSLLHAQPKEAGTFVMWSSGHPVRSDPGFGAKMKLPCQRGLGGLGL